MYIQLRLGENFLKPQRLSAEILCFDHLSKTCVSAVTHDIILLLLLFACFSFLPCFCCSLFASLLQNEVDYLLLICSAVCVDPYENKFQKDREINLKSGRKFPDLS